MSHQRSQTLGFFLQSSEDCQESQSCRRLQICFWINHLIFWLLVSTHGRPVLSLLLRPFALRTHRLRASSRSSQPWKKSCRHPRQLLRGQRPGMEVALSSKSQKWPLFSWLKGEGRCLRMSLQLSTTSRRYNTSVAFWQFAFICPSGQATLCTHALWFVSCARSSRLSRSSASRDCKWKSHSCLACGGSSIRRWSSKGKFPQVQSVLS